MKIESSLVRSKLLDRAISFALLLMISAVGSAQIKLPPLYGVPEINKAAHLGWGGYVTSQIAFSQFFGANHTMAAWFMPQYPYTYDGPIFADAQPSGPLTPPAGERYMVGQGNGMFGLGAHANLYIQLGGEIARYHTPGWQRKKWQHVAVVRRHNRLELYLNGEHLKPTDFAACKSASDMVRFWKNQLQEAPQAASVLQPAIDTTEAHLAQCVAAHPGAEVTIQSGQLGPRGYVQFGRWRTHSLTNLNDFQAFGFIDDAAIFTRALSVAEINAMRGARRLNGSENGLLAAWSFDQPGPNEFPQPPILDSSKTMSQRVVISTVSADRNSLPDGVRFDTAQLAPLTAVPVRPPIPVGEVWKVIQGFDEPLGSHWGAASFCYDLIKPPQSGIYPSGSIAAPVRTSSPGKVVQYQTAGYSESGQEKSFVAVQQAEGEVIYYRHLSAVPNYGGFCDENSLCSLPDFFAVPIPAGTLVGVVGLHAKHLHHGARQRVGGVTIPIAYSDYWVSPNGLSNWTHVTAGVPKDNQFIMRMN